MVSEIDKAYQRILEKTETTKLSEFTEEVIMLLEKLKRPELTELINELKEGKFDDFHVNAYPLPKMELVDRLQALKIWGLATDIQMGLFDV